MPRVDTQRPLPHTVGQISRVLLTGVALRCANVLVRPAALAEHRVEEDVQAALLVAGRRELQHHARVPEPRRLGAAQRRGEVGRLLRDERPDVTEVRLLDPQALLSANFWRAS